MAESGHEAGGDGRGGRGGDGHETPAGEADRGVDDDGQFRLEIVEEDADGGLANRGAEHDAGDDQCALFQRQAMGDFMAGDVLDQRGHNLQEHGDEHQQHERRGAVGLLGFDAGQLAGGLGVIGDGSGDAMAVGLLALGFVGAELEHQQGERQDADNEDQCG